jgi:23S rRNA (cytidine2498-2'-O)-methyltransferase
LTPGRPANGPAVAGTGADKGSLTGFVATVGFESALWDELGGGKADGPRWPGLLTTRRKVAIDPAFALQTLPAAAQVSADSVAGLAAAADEVIDERWEAGDGPVHVHVFVPDRFAYRTIAGRAALLEKALLERLREKRRHVLRRLVRTPAPIADEAFADTLVVQLALVGRTSLLVSASAPRRLPTGGFDIVPFPGGSAPVPEDKTAPSRAYRKLVEGFGWLGRAPGTGETCVDLGGSPGGWAYTALKAGASVTAVDRSPLHPPAAGHPALTMVLGNAFTYRPAAPVDWLLCDVICEPKKTIALLERWMSEGLCRFVSATLKFKGSADYPAIAEARARLVRQGWAFLRIKHLRNHSNEAVILARRD